MLYIKVKKKKKKNGVPISACCSGYNNTIYTIWGADLMEMCILCLKEYFYCFNPLIFFKYYKRFYFIMNKILTIPIDRNRATEHDAPAKSIIH
jgi:hypothetical protein